MESSTQNPMPEMRRAWAPIEQAKTFSDAQYKKACWFNFVMGYCSGTGLGIVVSTWIPRFRPWFMGITIGLLAYGFFNMWWEWRNFKVRRAEFKAEGERMMKMLKEDLEEMLPDDPVRVAGIMLDARKTLGL
jgi:hypothetical protein